MIAKTRNKPSTGADRPAGARIYADAPLAEGIETTLPPAAARHIAAVLRLRSGDRIEIFNGSGGSFDARIVSCSRDRVIVLPESFHAEDRESPLQVILVQGISRGRHMDYTVQKSVELGVSRIVPVMTAHGNVRLDHGQAERRLQHWRGIAVSACEQCGRNRVPEIDRPLPLPEWLERDNAALRLVLDPRDGAPPGSLPAPRGSLSLLSGPEGGLSAAEIGVAKASGCTGVRLGPRILRTETAAAAALAVCQTLWRDWA
jgi:16S rRNA (uracil1498-N3)-methyltransferase